MSTNTATAPTTRNAMESALAETIKAMFANGELSFDLPDSEISSTITRLYPHITTNTASEVARIAKEASTKLEALEETVTKKLRDAGSSMNEKKVKVIIDDFFRSCYAENVKAEAQAGNKRPLPALKAVDPFFVENTQTERIELALQTGRHAMASGPSGSGKTFPIENVLRKHGKRYLKVSVADGLTMGDFTAKANVRSTKDGTETYYTDGFLAYSMRHGIPVILDEVDQCQPEIVGIINAPLETNELFIPQTGETLTAKDGWQVFMTCNGLRDHTGNYAGFRMNAALLNRVVFIKADYLPVASERAIFERVGLNGPDAGTLVGMLQGLRAAYASGKLTQAPSTRIGVRIARCLMGQNDSGEKVAKPLKLADAFAFALIDGLPDAEAKEALSVLKMGL